MADLKITELTNLATPATEDVLPIVDDPTGVPVTKKVSISSIKTLLDTFYAAIGAGVTGGDAHDHSGGDGASIPLASGVL